MKQKDKNVSYYVSVLLIPVMDGLCRVIRPRVHLASVNIVHINMQLQLCRSTIHLPKI